MDKGGEVDDRNETRVYVTYVYNARRALSVEQNINKEKRKTVTGGKKCLHRECPGGGLGWGTL